MLVFKSKAFLEIMLNEQCNLLRLVKLIITSTLAIYIVFVNYGLSRMYVTQQMLHGHLTIHSLGNLWIDFSGGENIQWAAV